MNSGVKTKKKKKEKAFYAKSAKKQFLLTNFGVITSNLGVSGLELLQVAPSLILYLGHNPRFRGTILVWGAQAVIWGARPRNAPRGAGPDTIVCSVKLSRLCIRRFTVFIPA